MVDGRVLAAVQLVEVPVLHDERDEVRILYKRVCVGACLVVFGGQSASRRRPSADHSIHTCTHTPTNPQITHSPQFRTHHVLPRLRRLPVLRRAPVRRVDAVVRRQQRRGGLGRLALRVPEVAGEEGALRCALCVVCCGGSGGVCGKVMWGSMGPWWAAYNNDDARTEVQHLPVVPQRVQEPDRPAGVADVLLDVEEAVAHDLPVLLDARRLLVPVRLGAECVGGRGWNAEMQHVRKGPSVVGEAFPHLNTDGPTSP